MAGATKGKHEAIQFPVSKWRSSPGVLKQRICYLLFAILLQPPPQPFAEYLSAEESAPPRQNIL
jgi:hypothetical protein